MAVIVVTSMHALLRGWCLCTDCPHSSLLATGAGCMSFTGMAFGVTVTRGYPCGRQHSDAARTSVTESLESVTLSPYLAKEALSLRCATDLKMGKGTSCDPSGDGAGLSSAH